jgi:protein-tyrosine-phosphatase
MYRVLFICTENSNRSQMAEAFARMHGAGILDPTSAGSRPSGQVNPRAIDAMRERGYDLSTHRSKSVEEVGGGRWDRVVTMGCGDACPWVAADAREDWDLPDPRDLPPRELRAVRDEIEKRVIDLVGRVSGR